MKPILMGLFLAALGPVTAAGQGVEVEVGFDQVDFLPHEELVVSVKIRNFSGRTFQLGGDNEWLRFAVEEEHRGVVAQVGEIPVKAEFVLENAQMATRRVNIAPYFKLTQSGRYYVTATVRCSAQGPVVQSAAKPFQISTGVKVWEQVFGIPAPEGSGLDPVMRKYVALRALRNGRQILYLSLASPDERLIQSLKPVSSLTSVSKPEFQVDRHGELHLLNQYVSRSFHYCVIDAMGRVKSKKRFDLGAGGPELSLNAGGEIVVKGGIPVELRNEGPLAGADPEIKQNVDTLEKP